MNQHLIPNINKGRQHSQRDMEIAHPTSNLTVPNSDWWTLNYCGYATHYFDP